MAAGEEEPQPVVGSHGPARVVRGRPHGSQLLSQECQPIPVSRVAAEPVQGSTARHGEQPGARSFREAVARPRLEGRDQRLLDQLLREVPVAEDAEERCDQAPALLAHRRGQARIYLRAARSLRQAASYVPACTMTGRISMVSGPGQPLTRAIAASRSGTSMIP